MHVLNSHFGKLRYVQAACAAAAVMVAPVAGAAQPAASGYVATMADYLGVQEALQRYRFGVEKHDQKMLESAFWDDAVNIAEPTPGQQIRIPVKQSGPPPGPNAGPPGPNAGPPPGFTGPPPPGAPAGPPPGFAGPPPPGANAGPPPGAGRGRPGGGAGGEVWHLPLDSYIHFESATRATHYGYFLSIYPQPEKQPMDLSGQVNASSSRVSIVGWPGHYDDILEKRNGEWRILQRKSVINQK